MSPATRAWAAAAGLVLLAVAGEYVGAARRKILRREVSEGGMGVLQPGQVLVRAKGADGRPVPQAAVGEFVVVDGRRIRRTFGLGSGYCVLAPLEGAGAVRWIEISGPSDLADDPLPFGAVLAGPLPEGASSYEVVLPPEAALEGRIRRGQDPVQGVVVKARTVRPPELESLVGAGSEVWHATATADRDGRFRLGRLGAGLQAVSFDTPPGFVVADARAVSGTTLDIDLASGRVDTVTVLDGYGKPVHQAGVVVEVRGAGAAKGGAPCARGTTDRNGVVRIHRLDPAGRYRLVVYRPGAAPGNPAETREEWIPSDTGVSLRSQRSVGVRVVDEKGAPHRGVVVEAAPEESGRPSVTGTTGPDGRCSLLGIDAGPLKLTLRDPCSFRPRESVTTRDVPAKESQVSVTLARGAAIHVQRVDGGPWSAAVRAVLRKEGSNDAATGEFRGNAVTWHGLEAGATYAALLIDADRGLASRIEGMRPRAQPVKSALAPALSLRVSTRWPEGAEGRRVFAYWGEQSAGEGELQPDGTWVIRCLPAGKYLVGAYCTVPGAKEPFWTTVEAAAGGAAEIRFP